MKEPNRIYLVNAEPTGEELGLYPFPVIFRVAESDGTSYDVTYTSEGIRTVLKDTNTTDEARVIESFTRSRTTAESMNVAFQNFKISSGNFSLSGGGNVDVSAGGSLTVNNSSKTLLTSGYKLTLGYDGNLPTSPSSTLFFGGDSGMIVENVSSTNGKIIINSSNSKIEINKTDNGDVYIGSTRGIKFNTHGLCINDNGTDGSQSYILPKSSYTAAGQVLVSGTDINKSLGWATVKSLLTGADIVSMLTGNDLVDLLETADEASITRLKTLLGIS